jgi:hypothetical protein
MLSRNPQQTYFRMLFKRPQRSSRFGVFWSRLDCCPNLAVGRMIFFAAADVRFQNSGVRYAPIVTLPSASTTQCLYPAMSLLLAA